MKKGFTLIEILFSISIIGILSSAGIAAYVKFNQKQILIQTTQKIVQDLRLAQSLANNNQKPDKCGDSSLYGYIFTLFNNGENWRYKISSDCGSVDELAPDSDPPFVNLPSTFDFIPSAWTVKFKVLKRGVEFIPAGKDSLEVRAFNQSRIIKIDEGGAINIISP